MTWTSRVPLSSLFFLVFFGGCCSRALSVTTIRVDGREYCVKPRVALVGYNIEIHKHVPDVNTCAELCSQNSQCHFFTYRELQSTCYLKDRRSRLGAATLENHKSGTTDCRKNTCYVEDTELLVGHSFRTTDGVVTVEDCQKLCVKHSNCHFFSYERMRNRCLLKTFLAAGTAKTKIGVVSGHRTCDLPVRSVECLEHDVHYKHHDIVKLLDIFDVEECMAECTLVDSCLFFTFEQGSHTCSLKRAAARFEAVQEKGYISGPKYCGPSTCKHCGAPACFVHGRFIRGVELSIVRHIKNAEECQKHCLQERLCAIFAYNPATAECFLKAQGASLVPDPNFIAGPKTCDPMPPELEKTVEEENL